MLSHPVFRETRGWQYNGVYRDLQAAQSWGHVAPYSTFYELPRQERINMIAFEAAQSAIKAINDWEVSKEQERKAKRPRRK